MTNRVSESKTYAAFAGAVVIGGANFIAVSMSNMELPPLFGATFRFALGTVLFLLISGLARIPLARNREAAGAALYGLFGFGAAYALLYYALVGLAAGTVAVIVAAAPLFTLALAVLIGQERFTVRGVAGGMLAMVSITILSWGKLGNDFGGSHFVAALFGTCAIAASSIIAKRFPEVHPLSMNTIGMAAGTVLLAATSLMLGEIWTIPKESRTLMAVGWLVLLGSIGLFQLYLYVIRRWTASATVYALAAMPVVAVGPGAVMLDQPITAEVLAGGSVVIAAVYVGALSR